MIFTTSKSWAEIQAAIDQWHLKKVVVIGCGSCSAACQTGGTEGVKKIATSLEKHQISILASIIIEEPCDLRAVKQELKFIQNEVEKSDGLIVAACGTGAQTIMEVTNKPIIITTDTHLMAQTEQIGIYHEKCRACGSCVLNETGGICPITACAKSMLNGPCGGVMNGKCEVGNYTQPCGWILIYDRLKKLDLLDLFGKVRSPLDWSNDFNKRDSDVRKEMKCNYACK